MTTILVTGATSGPGGPLVEKLRAAGHEVRAMSRTAGDGRVVADLATGDGLSAAVAGAEVVVHLATNRRKDLPDTERLLAAARDAGVKHLVLSHLYPASVKANVKGLAGKRFKGKIRVAIPLDDPNIRPEK